MSIFDAQNQVKHGNQKISENFLKKMGFKKSNQWGVPYSWGPDTVFWEKIINVEGGYTDASLIYFPSTFKGYVTDFNSKGKEPSNKLLAQINTDDTRYDFNGEANCKNDLYFGIDKITYNLKKYLKTI